MKKKRKTKNLLGKFMLVVLFSLFYSFAVMAQKTNVSGTVTGSDDGQPLPGVTIVVKGTTNGVVTDMDGKYSIAVQNGDILKFSFVGMTTKEIDSSGKSVINVVLESDAVALADVVVVGFGKQKRESVVGSISKATGEQIRQAGSVSTVSEALAGILPGVTVIQDAGMPGVTDATILIRGVSTWAEGGNKPLYMVDGVERDFNNIDPNEIESISVLKDASATAVFGLKAANGVILITTKRGVSGKPKVDISANFGMKYPSLNFEYDKDYANVLRHQNIAFMNDYNYGLLNTQTKIDQWSDPNRDPDFYSYTFWGEEMIKKGYTRQYNINISGGNKFVKYFTSLGYHYDGDLFDTKEQPQFDPRTFQKRYNWRSNLDFQFTETTKLSVNLSGDYRDWNGNSVTESMYNTGGYGWGGGNKFRNLFTTVMIGPSPILSDGRFGINEGVSSPPSTALTDMAYTGQNMRRSNRIYTDFVLEQEIIDGLKLTGKLSFNYERAYENSIWLNEIFFYPDYIDHVIKPFEPEGRRTVPKVTNEEIDSFGKTTYYDIRLSYNKKFNEVHDLGLLALFSRRNHQGGVNFPFREESWVGRATYGFRDKYFVEFNGAYNGNENWAPGLKFGFFPSGAVGWLVSEESFIKDNLPFLEYFKIRYSYGIVGSASGIGGNRFTYMSQFDTGNGGVAYARNKVFFGDEASVTNYSPIYVEGTPPNPENTWEESIKQNIGFEFASLDGKLSLEVDLFDEQRSGILMQRTVPSWFGNSSPYANIGKTKNHGIDIGIKYNGNIAKKLQYNLSGNLSLSENRIVEMDDAPFAEEKHKMAGRPIGMSSGIIGVGFMNSWDDVYNATGDQQTSTMIRPGDYMWVDMNSDGVISNEDYARILSPTYAANSYAFTLGLNYKNFRLQGMFNGVFNVTRRLDSKYQFALTESELLTPEQKDHWSVDNMDASSPRLTNVGSFSKRNETTYNRFNSSFLRLRTIELSYTVGKGLRDRIGLFSNLELYLNGHNLYVWSKLPKAFDPESAELQAYPIPKTYNIGLRLGL